jgi:sortase A
MKIVRIVACGLLLVGSALTARAAYLHAKAELAGILIRRAWDQAAASGQSRPPWPWADTHPIARLQIPRLGYDEIVLEGDSLRTLAFGPARVSTGVQPGEPGNLLVAGHRTNWFRSLQTIKLNDEINLEWFDLQHRELLERRYLVTAIQIVQPDAAGALLAPTSGDALTLITCYPFGPSPFSPERFLVRAAPAAPSRVAQAHPLEEEPGLALSRRYAQTAFAH